MSSTHPVIDFNDTAAAERWERIIRVENLQADTNLKMAQTKLVPWQAYGGGATAAAAVIGAAIAIGHFL